MRRYVNSNKGQRLASCEARFVPNIDSLKYGGGGLTKTYIKNRTTLVRVGIVETWKQREKDAREGYLEHLEEQARRKQI